MEIPDLISLYADPLRHYHNLAHIEAMLAAYEQLVAEELIAFDERQGLAIWFHDAIYEPTRRDNEARSAQLLTEWMAHRGYDAESIRVAAAVVRDTATHHPSQPESAVVIDLDLMMLALPWPQFTAAGDRIRCEYAHLKESEWLRGRLSFLRQMAARERLFHTDFGRAKWELQARANLARAAAEIERALQLTDEK